MKLIFLLFISLIFNVQSDSNLDVHSIFNGTRYLELLKKIPSINKTSYPGGIPIFSQVASTVQSDFFPHKYPLRPR